MSKLGPDNHELYVSEMELREEIKVTIRCQNCKRSKRIDLHISDPKGTKVVECLCENCDNGGGFPETNYFDQDGNQLLPE